MLFIAHIRQNFAGAFFLRLAEWYAAILLFALGWILWVKPDLMQSEPSGIYGLMKLVATQPQWSIGIMMFACMRLAVLTINGAWRRSPHLRWISALLSMFFWMQIALSFRVVENLSLVFAIGILLLDFANMIRAAYDARIADYKHDERQTGAGAGS